MPEDDEGYDKGTSTSSSLFLLLRVLCVSVVPPVSLRQQGFDILPTKQEMGILRLIKQIIAAQLTVGLTKRSDCQKPWSYARSLSI